jgi:DNA-binding transcriptional LysR family regulator
VLAELDRAFETTRRTARGEEGRISVGIAPASSFHPFVPRVIRAFREAYPLVTVRLEERFGWELTEMVRREQLDVALIRTPPPDDPEGLVLSALLEEPMLIALPAAHPLAGSGPHDNALLLKQLARETFVLYAPLGAGLREVVNDACREAGFSPRVGQEAPRIIATLSLVAAGLGITVVPDCMQHVYMDGVVYRRIRGPVQPKAPLGLVSRRGDPTAVVRHFLNQVKQAAKDFRPRDG